jgi:hypothetical protein
VRSTLFQLSVGAALVTLLGVAGARATDGKAGATKPGSTTPAVTTPLDKEEAASCHGTSVHFVDTPAEAAKQAKKDEKLVFILHVSGNFEDPKFT